MSKVMVVVVAALLLATGRAWACGPGEDCVVVCDVEQTVTNEYITQVNQETTQINEVERDGPRGIGADVVLWESPKEVFAVESQYKYDGMNQEHSIFFVGKLNLWKMFAKQ